MNNASRIACLGWGSLVWDPGDLPVIGAWDRNGPPLPVEFARESRDGRITLVICNNVQPVTTLWTLLDVQDLQSAIAVLGKREGITKNLATDVGFFDASVGKSQGAGAAEITAWAKDKGLDGIVWTNLPCGLKSSRGVIPAAAEVIEHLKSLDEEKRTSAREYVENAPNQIDTGYRTIIRSEFGWA